MPRAHAGRPLRAFRLARWQMPDGAGTKRKDYDLDMKDNFWRSNVGTIFPEVAGT